jgi:hypothetical protein
MNLCALCGGSCFVAVSHRSCRVGIVAATIANAASLCRGQRGGFGLVPLLVEVVGAKERQDQIAV